MFMETTDTSRSIYRGIYYVGLGLLVGGIVIGIYQSFREVGTLPNISYQRLQNELITRLEQEGKYAEAVEQKRLAASYNAPFGNLMDGSPRDYGEMTLAWYAAWEESDKKDPLCYHHAVINYLTMQGQLQKTPTSDLSPELKQTKASLAEIEPVKSGRWSVHSPQIYVDLAWNMATSGNAMMRDTASALRFAKRAVKLSTTPRARLFDTLAAAQAASGDYEQAIATASQAVQLAESSGNDPQRLEAIKERLALYQQGQIYVAPSADKSGPGY